MQKTFKFHLPRRLFLSFVAHSSLFLAMTFRSRWWLMIGLVEVIGAYVRRLTVV